MAATISYTHPTSTLTTAMSYDYRSSTCSESPTRQDNLNNNNNQEVYPYNANQLLSKEFKTSEYFCSPELLSTPINLPPGYISISSVTKRNATTHSGPLVASTKYDSDFWPPSLNVFSKQRTKKISFAEEALPDETFLNIREDQVQHSGESDRTTAQDTGMITSLSSFSLPKLPERSWFCTTCRKPRDECHCLCVIS